SSMLSLLPVGPRMARSLVLLRVPLKVTRGLPLSWSAWPRCMPRASWMKASSGLRRRESSVGSCGYGFDPDAGGAVSPATCLHRGGSSAPAVCITDHMSTARTFDGGRRTCDHAAELGFH